MFSHRYGPSLFLLLALAITAVRADEGLEKRSSWREPTVEDVKSEIDRWLLDQQTDELMKQRLETIWGGNGAQTDGQELLDLLVTTISLVDESTTELVQVCRSDQPPQVLPTVAYLQDSDTAPLVGNNLRLYYGRWLAQRDLYDECLAQIDSLQPADVVDPAALLFYQAAAHHRLLDKEQCLAAIAKLLENKDAIPRRYETVAMLMESDIKPLKTDSLNEVARLMDDIERRLGLGRAGKRVRKEEDDVVAKLDKMIEEIEKQQQQQQQSAAGAGQSSRPMQDSQPGGGTGPGNVQQRRIGSGSGWGNLPPKQRQEALQQISKSVPSHYREVIEEYFRKLARDE